MYLLDSMIELGLKKGQRWPTKAHRQVACNIALANPLVKSRDHLSDIVQKVISIPRSRIKTVTIGELREYGIGIHCSANSR